jgi:hypothetical protein
VHIVDVSNPSTLFALYNAVKEYLPGVPAEAEGIPDMYATKLFSDLLTPENLLDQVFIPQWKRMLVAAGNVKKTLSVGEQFNILNKTEKTLNENLDNDAYLLFLKYVDAMPRDRSVKRLSPFGENEANFMGRIIYSNGLYRYAQNTLEELVKNLIPDKPDSIWSSSNPADETENILFDRFNVGMFSLTLVLADSCFYTESMNYDETVTPYAAKLKQHFEFVKKFDALIANDPTLLESEIILG